MALRTCAANLGTWNVLSAGRLRHVTALPVCRVGFAWVWVSFVGARSQIFGPRVRKRCLHQWLMKRASQSRVWYRKGSVHLTHTHTRCSQHHDLSLVPRLYQKFRD